MTGADDESAAGLARHVVGLRAAAGRDRSAALALARVQWIAELLAGLPRDLRGDLLAAAIDEHHAGRPQALMGPIAHEARWWAQWADPLELEAYLAAICDALPERSMAEAARKRALLTLWESLPDDWRRRFVAKVTGQ